MAVEASEVFDEHVAGPALEGDVVVAAVDFALADDDSLAADVDGVGVGGVAGGDDADVFDRDIFAIARHEMKTGRIRERDTVDVQSLDS